MSQLLVIGKSGQLALSLKSECEKCGIDAIFSSRDWLDMSKPEMVRPALEKLKPSAIINASAYTAVDKAEEEEALATLINADSVAEVAAYAAAVDIPFLHVSTDYVFTGDKDTDYVETDSTGPTGAYGRSKLKGEEMALAANPQTLIFRTAWVYSPYGHNFLKTMLRLAESYPEVKVVADQIGNPTYAPDIATALLDVLPQVTDSVERQQKAGIYHMAGTGTTSWAGFAEAIFDAGKAHGHSRPNVKHITSDEFPTPTKRPANSRLICDKLAGNFGVSLPNWKDSTVACINEIFADQAQKDKRSA